MGVLSALFATLSGWHGAISAFLGGLIGFCGTLAFAFVASFNKGQDAGRTVAFALRAEAAKIIVIIMLLALVLKTYKNVVAVGLIAAFTVSVLILAMAFFVQETKQK